MTEKKKLICPNCGASTNVDKDFKSDMICNKCGYIMREE